MNQIKSIEDEINNITNEEIENLFDDQYTKKYRPFELYILAVRKARLYPDSGHEGFDIAQESARLTAHRFLSEIKELIPNMYEHFRELASNEMPVA